MKRKGAIVTKVISALAARTQFGQIMRRANRERGRFVVGKRGGPQVIMGICDYIKIVAPEPEILRLIGKESKRKGTNKLTMREINAEIKAYRKEKRRENDTAEARA
jgi:hypothetical protein